MVSRSTQVIFLKNIYEDLDIFVFYSPILRRSRAPKNIFSKNYIRTFVVNLSITTYTQTIF